MIACCCNGLHCDWDVSIVSEAFQLEDSCLIGACMESMEGRDEEKLIAKTM